jgi:hypothetical protein
MKALIQVAEKGSWKFISFMIHKESEEGISRIFGTFFHPPNNACKLFLASRAGSFWTICVSLVCQPVHDLFGQHFAFVFLNKVSAVLDDFMGLIFCTRHHFLKVSLAAFGDGIGIAKQC